MEQRVTGYSEVLELHFSTCDSVYKNKEKLDVPRCHTMSYPLSH